MFVATWYVTCFKLSTVNANKGDNIVIKGLFRTLCFVGCLALLSFTPEGEGRPLFDMGLTDSGIIAQNNSTVRKNTIPKDGGRVGIVVSVKGKNFINREDGPVVAAPKTNILVGDELTTSNAGYLQVTFIDGSILKLVGKGSISVKDFLFNEEEGEAGGELTTEGATFVFVSGKMSKIAPQNFKVKTATATIGIRGSTIDASVGAGGDMQLTGGGIYADPVSGGDTLIFSHDGAPVAFEITSGGVQSIPVPDGGFFAVAATKIFGDEAGSITETQEEEEEEESDDETASDNEEEEDDDEEADDSEESDQEEAFEETDTEEDEEEESSLGSTMDDGDDTSEDAISFEEFFLAIDLNSVLEIIKSFDLDESLLAAVEPEKELGFSGKFFERGSINSLHSLILYQGLNKLFVGQDFSTNFLPFENVNYRALTQLGSDAKTSGFFALNGSDPMELGFLGKEKGIEYLNKSDGIINFTSALGLYSSNTGDNFPLSVASPSGTSNFVGENDVFIDIAHKQLFGYVTFEPEEHILNDLTDAEILAEDIQGRAEFYNTIGFILPPTPNLLFYTNHQALDTETGEFEEDSLHIAANLGYGVINGEFVGGGQQELLNFDDFDGSAQLYGNSELEGVGIFSSPSNGGEGAFVAASFSEGHIIEDSGPVGLVEYVGMSKGLKLTFNSVNSLVNSEIQHANALSFSVDLSTKELDEDSLDFVLNDSRNLNFTSGTSFVLSQDLVFSALDSSSLDPSQSFLLANPVPIVSIPGSSPVKVEGVLWGSYNLVNSSATEINPGQMNYFVAADVTDDSYFLSGSSVKTERKDTPLVYYKGGVKRTIVDPNLFSENYSSASGSDDLPFFTEEGYSSVLVNYEDETFKHFSVFPDGFLLVGSGDLETVDLNGATSGGEHFGFSGDDWSVINLGPHFHSEMFAKGALEDTSTAFPNSDFSGAFASSDAEGLFYSFQREHTAAGNVDQAIYGVGTAAKVLEKAIEANPVITTGFVHGVLVDKATGNLVGDIIEDGHAMDFSKRWKDDTNLGDIKDLDLSLQVTDVLKPIYDNILAINTDVSQSENRDVLTLYSDYDSGDSNSTLQRYSAEINNVNAKLKDISYSYTFNAKNVIEKIGDANSADTTNATANALPLRILLYAKDNAGKFYLLATEAKTYSSSTDFDNWITEDFDPTTGNIQAIRVDSLSDLELHDTIQNIFDLLDSSSSLPASTLDTWLAHGSSDPIADDAEVFKVVLKWGDATHTNEDTDTDTMALFLDNFTIKGADDEVIFEEEFSAIPLEDSLFIDKDAFYVPFDLASQSIFTPDISGYTKVAGKTMITAIPGLEEYEYLVWGIWSSEMTEDATPSNHVEAFGMFGGGMINELTDPSGYSSFSAANTIVNYSGVAIGNIFNLSDSHSEFRSGTAEINVNFGSNSVTGGRIDLGNAQVKLNATTLDQLSKGLPFNGATQLGIGGLTPTGTGSYKGQFFGNNSKYAVETSGSFSATNATHKVIGAFGAKK
ncbi:hypothetical protein AB751O23_AH_00090 [Chlamydiales bacterium SCGC AB-751-O23]|nr:hypothetical protein AB751O23_AH_00090 [Chlamydiales bacterium SCGC AB-751-O23]